MTKPTHLPDADPATVSLADVAQMSDEVEALRLQMEAVQVEVARLNADLERWRKVEEIHLSTVVGIMALAKQLNRDYPSLATLDINAIGDWPAAEDIRRLR